MVFAFEGLAYQVASLTQGQDPGSSDRAHATEATRAVIEALQP